MHGKKSHSENYLSNLKRKISFWQKKSFQHHLNKTMYKSKFQLTKYNHRIRFFGHYTFHRSGHIILLEIKMRLNRKYCQFFTMSHSKNRILQYSIIISLSKVSLEKTYFRAMFNMNFWVLSPYRRWRNLSSPIFF